MSASAAICSVCNSEFVPEFSYQTEKVAPRDPNSPQRFKVSHFCSQQCLDISHREASGSASCSVCGRPFSVELVSQVIFLAGRRYYACQSACRTQLLQAAQSHGKTLNPSATRDSSDVRWSLASADTDVAPPGANLEVPSTAPKICRDTKAPSANQGQVLALPGSRPASPPVSWRRVEATLAGPPKVLAVFNHKGGTGKTTTAVTVAALLASRGKNVLLVDTDGQGNVAVSLGIVPRRTLYHVLVLGQPYAEALTSARTGLDVLPANETLAAAELYLAGRAQRDRVLAERLGATRAQYDHVIVDCSPSLSLMSQNTLAFADAVLCPVACDYLSLVGVRQVLRTIKQVNRVLGHPVRLWGILPTLFDSRARVCREALSALRDHFTDRCLEPIRTSIKAKEAPAHGKTLLEHAPDVSCTLDYARVVDRLLEERLRPAEPLSTTAGGAQ